MPDEPRNAPLQAGTLFDALPPLPADAAVTMAYVPFQIDKTVYSEEDALCRGTLFQTLNKPFLQGAIR